MVTPVDVGLVLVGLLLAFVGAALSVYAVTLAGFLVGAGTGYVFAPSLLGVVGAEGLVATAGIVVVVGLVGAFLAYAGLSFAVMGIGGIVGAFIARFAVAPIYVAGTWETAAVTVVGLVVGALFGLIATKLTLVFTSGFIGSAFATRSLTLAEFQAAQETLSIEPLIFDMLSPLFLAVFVLGVLFQVGLFRFGYVTKLVGIVPGARRWTAGEDKSGS
ncbi:phosphate ABC transporter permease [Halalkaliarchaeum sp. AArc-GB]|uniref:phosphate ABC transporter permease n=1 Tax=Halalkaliarchaeum sp. AArc-GB TaxID=3074078 RepID=UPI002861A904|nr:phosphate ABC transporter permease [Halalkaliarchaeum sp. AArc-GB]MDR5672850.1 phosphate ABC transporter permease [Halalkaliarchaeum sp. AArc-GB]